LNVYGDSGCGGSGFPVEMAQEAVPKEASKRGRKRKAWQPLELVRMPDHGSLRKAGQEWLALKGLGHKPLSKSWLDGRTTYISKCDSCLDCTEEWLFQCQEGNVSVSEAGSLCLKQAHAQPI